MNNKLQFLVENYQTLPDAIELVAKTRILLLAGISGAGKDTTKRHLLKNEEYCDIVSHTTRRPRLNNGKEETDGIDYNFIDSQEAEIMLKERQFIEAKFVHGNIYATSVSQIYNAYSNNKIAVTDIDINGIAEYKKISPSVVAVFILPPDYDIWRSRFANRYNDKEEFEREFKRRLPEAINSLTTALDLPYFHFILNEDFRDTARIIDQIMHQPIEFNYKDIEVRVRAQKMLEDLKKQYNKIK